MPRINLSAVKTGAEIGSIRKKLIAKSIKESSASTYTSNLSSLFKFMSQLRGDKSLTMQKMMKTITKDEWIMFANVLMEQDIGFARGVHASLLKETVKAGITIQWIHDDDVKMVNKAVLRNAKSKKKPCGTVTSEMMDDLKELFRSQKDDELFYSSVMAWGARLRIGELGLMNETDLDENDSACPLLQLHEWKQGPIDENPAKKPLPTYLVQVFKAIVKRKFGKNGRLFAPGIDTRLRKAIPAAAIKLKWSQDFCWAGPHVFRHGGSGELKKLSDRISSAVLSIFAQQTPSTFAAYATQGSDRLKKKRRLE